MVIRGDLCNDQKILFDAWVLYWDFQNKKEEARKRAEEKRKNREEEDRID